MGTAGHLICTSKEFTSPASVEHTVTSDGPLAVVSPYDATGALQSVTNQPVPWFVSFTSKDASPAAVLSVNGTVTDTKSKTGAGQDNIVQCLVTGNP